MGGVQLVTGGSGYFGDALIRALLARGERVRVFDLREARDRPPTAELVLGDIRDRVAVRAACRDVEVIYHAVAQVPLAKDRKLFLSVNRDGTRNVVEAALECGAGRLVYVSSSAVFGLPEQNPVPPDAEPRPQESYGRAKLEGERICREHAGSKLSIAIVRPRTILGAGRLGIFQILFEWVREGRGIPIPGRGDGLFQFVHPSDLATACIAASRRPGLHVYHCGTDRFGSLANALEALCRHAGTGSRVRRIPAPPLILAMRAASALGLSPLGPYHALLYGRAMYFDIARTTAELQWRPRFSNEEMMLEAYDWYLRNRETILGQANLSPHRSAVRQGAIALLKLFF